MSSHRFGVDSTPEIRARPSPGLDRPALLKFRLRRLDSRRGALDLEALARRRSHHIQAHLKTAQDAYAAGDYDTAIAEAERVLILDAEQDQALELVDRAKTALDERQAEQWLLEAEGDIQRGALTAALSKIEHATELSPSSQ